MFCFGVFFYLPHKNYLRPLRLMGMPVAPSSVSDVTLHPHSPIFSVRLVDWFHVSNLSFSTYRSTTVRRCCGVKNVHMYIWRNMNKMTRTVISISIPPKSKGKDNLKEAVLSTCSAGSDGQNVAGCTHAQAVLGKYADIIGGGVNL